MMVNLSSQDTIQAHFTFQGLHRPAPQRMLHMSSIYDFEALSISGQPMALSSYRGQVMLIVNGDSAHPLYKYLTAEAPGILESKGIKWNFTKQFNICPTKAQTPTAVNAGSIGVLISGSVLYGAAEIEGHRATTLNDNAFHTFRSREGQTITASFIDQCNGHPTPNNAGNSYHYHALSECVTSKVDHESGPSHLIGVALDGFPIYGDKDLSGKTIRPDLLAACNGINSPTPEFPQGVYHYVLPSNVTQHNASMRCYSGNLSRKALAIANASGFCYAPRTESIKNFAEKMDMRGR